MEWTSGDIHRFNTDAAALRGVARSKKWGGQYGLGVGRDIPSQVWGYGLGYKLKLISTLHNDSIPETPSGKKWGGRVHPSPLDGNAPGRTRRDTGPRYSSNMKICYNLPSLLTIPDFCPDLISCPV